MHSTLTHGPSHHSTTDLRCPLNPTPPAQSGWHRPDPPLRAKSWTLEDAVPSLVLAAWLVLGEAQQPCRPWRDARAPPESQAHQSRPHICVRKGALQGKPGSHAETRGGSGRLLCSQCGRPSTPAGGGTVKPQASPTTTPGLGSIAAGGTGRESALASRWSPHPAVRNWKADPQPVALEL